MKATKSQYVATGNFHARMARAYTAVGKTADAKAARRAESAAKRSAKDARR